MASSPAPGRSRRRLGVAVLLDPPVADEVDGLRRAVGDPSLGRIPPHITLVPPVNVRRDDLADALRVVRQAAAAVRTPVQLTLGHISTFLPVNPVLYLAVGGDLDQLAALRNAVFRPPLERTLSWPWVPHVTLADGAPAERLAAALVAMGDYAAVACIDRVVLLEGGPGRVWTPLADAGLGPPARIGTGGLVVELVRGRLIDPRLIDPRLVDPRLDDDAPDLPHPVLTAPLVVNAHREGEPVGWARASVDGDGTRIEVYVVEEHRRQGIGGHMRAHLDWAVSRNPTRTQ
jgi:2'-5' RNA ligase